MARPKNCRRIGSMPGCTLFKPAGVPGRDLDEISLAVDELEALRLADHEGLYQQEAAKRMGVSRQTFGRIVDSARKKVAKVLVEGLALRIEGGNVKMAEMRTFQCADCGHVWEVPFGTGRPAECPACQGTNFHRAQEMAVAQVGGPGGGPGGGRMRRRQGGPGGGGAGEGRRASRGRGVKQGRRANQGRAADEAPVAEDTSHSEDEEPAT